VSDWECVTHQLESAQEGTSQDSERMPETEGHSPPGERRGRVMSGERQRAEESVELTLWRLQRGGTGQDNKRWQADEGHPRSGERGGGGTSQDSEIKRVGKGNHILESAEGGTSQKRKQMRASERHSHTESAEGGTSQESKQMRASERHSHSEEYRRRNKSGKQRNASEQGALTGWRAQR
jgi:hypothetical protein